MTKKELKSDALLLLAAAIWGFAFAAQRVGAQYIGGLTFNGIRFAMGSLSLLPLIFFYSLQQKNQPKPQKKLKKGVCNTIWFASLCAGTVLCIAVNLQQFAIAYTTAGKAGFITGLYVVFVPIFGLFLKKKVPYTVWIGVCFACAGLFLLCINNNFSINFADGIILISTVFWALHILSIDFFVKRVDAVQFASAQFAVCALFCLIGAFFTESITLIGLKGALIPMLYAGLGSVGIAYTLQVVAQKDAPPAQAAIMFSMETVFSAIGGALILGEKLGIRALVGCIFIFTAILISQIKGISTYKERKKHE